jgi:hypothetical protein
MNLSLEDVPAVREVRGWGQHRPGRSLPQGLYEDVVYGSLWNSMNIYSCDAYWRNKYKKGALRENSG